MCGIAVAIDWPDAAAHVRSLVGKISHRGEITDPIHLPRPNTALVTRRLPIVDAEHATQPQLSDNGRVAVAFNGEIYNHVELRAELEMLGCTFRTASDTEVLANALQVWGPGALCRFNGMFAFVAVDHASGAFLAARDPFGVKPLYVIQSGRSLLFCSEIRPLLDTVPHGDILLVPPGYAVSRAGCRRYRTLAETLPSRLVNDPVDTLDDVLFEAVRRRVPSNLPTAIMFSGGLDSTLVAHYARQTSSSVAGYFIGEETAPDYPYARDYADKTGFDLRRISIDPSSDETFASIRSVVQICESFEPNLIRGALCSLAAARAMRDEGLKVALCGEGADELFCGYAPVELAFADDEALGQQLRNECLCLMHRMGLQRVDRCAMHYGLEMREPFLDPSVASLALGLERHDLVRPQHGRPAGKAILRDLCARYPDAIPVSIRNRTKVPLGEGSGFDTSPRTSWKARFEAAITDRALSEGRRQFPYLNIGTKEELYYARALAEVMDLERIPHLHDRAWISFPVHRYREQLKTYQYAEL